MPVPVRFQSTLSVRRATDPVWPVDPWAHISIHALREESDYAIRVEEALDDISIHALREESDRPTQISDGCRLISIHALREESDAPFPFPYPVRKNFNPRSP